jgi:hypothetical protein
VRRVQLLARVGAPTLPAKPLSIEQMRTGVVGRKAGAAEARDRLAVELVGSFTLADERARARFQSEGQIGAARRCPLGQQLDPHRRIVARAGAGSGLDQLCLGIGRHGEFVLRARALGRA